MPAIEATPFTIAVFQDVTWARNGIDALLRAGLLKESLSAVAKSGDEALDLIQSRLGVVEPARLDLPEVGAVVAAGPLVAALNGEADEASALTKLGLAGSLRRVGFQSHDGRIYETLTARGGVLVAVHSASRAADALAIFLSYGGGNAAIGAWTGRV